MRKCVGALVVIASVLVSAAPATAAVRPASVPGSIGVRLIDAPDTTADDARGRIYIVGHLAPGASLARRIEISNTTASGAHVALYAAAATNLSGSFLGAAGHTANELSSWTFVDPPLSEVGAGARAIATVRIDVPKDTAPGDRTGVVWAEVRSTRGGFTEVSRVGIRLYISVGDGGAPVAGFTVSSIKATRTSRGEPMVVATVLNSGARALDISGTLQLVGGPGGLSAGPFPASLGTTLAIGASHPVTIVLDPRVPKGPWDAQITLHSGSLERSLRATIVFPAIAVSSTMWRWVPTAVAGFVLLLLISGIGAVGRRKPRAAARLGLTH